MPDHLAVDDWLDQWEQALEHGHEPALEQFIAEHCQGAPPDLVEEFRSRVHALRSVGGRLAELAGSQATGAGDASATSDRAAVGLDLRPGGEPVPGHRLVRRLGRGGYGEVWLATAPGDMPVALKLVRLNPQADRVESRALDLLKTVRHPHLLPTFGAWRQSDHLIIGMELADGTLMGRLLEAQAQGHPGIPGPELLCYMAEAAKGLDYLNGPRQTPQGNTAAGIQHRDIKPHNLLLVGGSVKVGDFGLARCLEHSQASHTGPLTFPYAAPEFFRDRTCRHSDQYSLAVTYCQLRGGRLPFTGSREHTMYGHLHGEPDLSMLPDAERPAVRRALAKQPDDRWPTCAAFVAALRQAHGTGHGQQQGELLDEAAFQARHALECCRQDMEQIDALFRAARSIKPYLEAVAYARMPLWRKAALRGSGDAQWLLGYCRAEGVGGPADLDAAVRLYRQAAAQGHAISQFTLGRLYDRGEGVFRNPNKSARLIRSAAEQGFVEAQRTLGDMYLQGRCVAQDTAEAARWYRRAAQNGHPFAQDTLGVLYESGSGVARDLAEAMSWYRRAANQGLDSAMYRLACLYVAENPLEARHWFGQAAARGHLQARRVLEAGYGREFPEESAQDDT